MSEVFSHCGTQVFVSADGSSFTPIGGYSGGLRFGMSESLVQDPGSDDGVQRQLKGESQGAESSVAVRHISGDAGQAIVKGLCPIDNEGRGFMRAVYPGGRTVTAEGIFHSRVHNPIEAGPVQGFEFTFSQQEPETES